MSTQTEVKTPRPRQFTLAERNEHFPLDYEVEIERNGKASVRVPAAWETANIARVNITGTTWCPRVHKRVAHLFDALFMLVHEAGVGDVIKTYDGGFYPRLKRGVTLPPAGSPKSAYDKLLSNHSRGTAIDLNAKWNPMGKPYDARKLGGEGDLSCVINIADTIKVMQPNGQHWGIVCGAHWKGASIDPMHFEIGVWP